MNARIIIKIKSERVDRRGGGFVTVNLVHIILVGKQPAPPTIWHRGLVLWDTVFSWWRGEWFQDDSHKAHSIWISRVCSSQWVSRSYETLMSPLI